MCVCLTDCHSILNHVRLISDLDGAKEAEKEATSEDVKQKTPEKVKRTDGKSLSISELKGLTDKERIFKV